MILVIIMVGSMSIVSVAKTDSKLEGFVHAEQIYVEVEKDAGDMNRLASRGTSGIYSSAQEIREELLRQVQDKVYISPRRSTTSTAWEYLPGFVVYNQQKSDYCGLACIQTVLRYKYNIVVQQADLEDYCGYVEGRGTTIPRLYDYLYYNHSALQYLMVKDYVGIDLMKDCLSDAIETYDRPAIIGLYCSTENGWLYSLVGHAVTVYGARADQAYYALGDPWIGYINSGITDIPWTYPKSADDLFEAYDLLDYGLIY